MRRSVLLRVVLAGVLTAATARAQAADAQAPAPGRPGVRRVQHKTPLQVGAGPSIKQFEAGTCVQVTSSGSFGCRDAGNVDSTCAKAVCPAGRVLTGGGGACAAGDRRIKSLFPNLTAGEYTIVCEQQGVDPQAVAICCNMP